LAFDRALLVFPPKKAPLPAMFLRSGAASRDTRRPTSSLSEEAARQTHTHPYLPPPAVFGYRHQNDQIWPRSGAKAPSTQPVDQDEHRIIGISPRQITRRRPALGPTKTCREFFSGL